MAARALNWYQRLGLNKWYTNFRLEHSVRKNRTTFSDVPLLPESFHWNDPKSSLRRRHSTPPVGFDNAWAGCNAGYPKSRVPFTFQPKFPESCCKWETTKVSNDGLSYPGTALEPGTLGSSLLTSRKTPVEFLQKHVTLRHRHPPSYKIYF